MNATDRSLMASGIAATAALVVATVSVTVALVAYMQPLATVPETGAPVDRLVSGIWIFPAVALACAVIGMGQVLGRRPVLWDGKEACRACSGMGPVTCVTVLSLVLSMYVIFRSIDSQTMSMTDATSFGVLSPGVAVFALVLYWMSDVLFKRWWRHARPPAE